MERKTIWYISKYASPVKYGLGTRHFYLSEEWVKKGYRVSVITSNAPAHGGDKLPSFTKGVFREVINGVEAIWLKTYRYKESRSLKRIISWLHFEWRLLRFSQKHGLVSTPQVIIVSSPSLFTVLNGIYMSRKYNAKLVFEIRDIWPMTITEIGKISQSNLFIRVLSYIERLGYKHADYIVGTMPNLVEHVKKFDDNYGKKVVFIPQGANLRFYEEEQKSLDDEYISKYFPRDKFTVAHAGKIGLSKGVDVFIETARLLKKYPHIKFLFLGKKDAIVERLLQSEELSNITFLAPVDKAYVNDFLTHADLLTFALRKSDLYRYGTSPHKLTDYMYAEKPIIASYSGYPFLINEAKCGEFVPAEDANALAVKILEYSKKSKEELDEMGKRGREFLLKNRRFKDLAVKYAKLF